MWLQFIRWSGEGAHFERRLERDLLAQNNSVLQIKEHRMLKEGVPADKDRDVAPVALCLSEPKSTATFFLQTSPLPPDAVDKTGFSCSSKMPWGAESGGNCNEEDETCRKGEGKNGSKGHGIDLHNFSQATTRWLKLFAFLLFTLLWLCQPSQGE